MGQGSPPSYWPRCSSSVLWGKEGTLLSLHIPAETAYFFQGYPGWLIEHGEHGDLWALVAKEPACTPSVPSRAPPPLPSKLSRLRIHGRGGTVSGGSSNSNSVLILILPMPIAVSFLVSWCLRRVGVAFYLWNFRNTDKLLASKAEFAQLEGDSVCPSPWSSMILHGWQGGWLLTPLWWFLLPEFGYCPG